MERTFLPHDNLMEFRGLVEQPLEVPRRLLMDGVPDLFLKERIYGNGSHQREGVV